MKDYMNNVLETGEKVLWEGSPEHFELLDKANKSSIITKWVVVGGAYIAAVIGYLSIALSRGDDLVSMALLVGVVSVFAILALMAPITDRKMLLNGTHYVLTDRRAIVINKNGEKSLKLEEGTACRIIRLENGSDALCFGTACDVPATKLRSTGIIGIKGMGSGITGLTFYGIKNAREVCLDNTISFAA